MDELKDDLGKCPICEEPYRIYINVNEHPNSMYSIRSCDHINLARYSTEEDVKGDLKIHLQELKAWNTRTPDINAEIQTVAKCGFTPDGEPVSFKCDYVAGIFDGESGEDWMSETEKQIARAKRIVVAEDEYYKAKNKLELQMQMLRRLQQRY